MALGSFAAIVVWDGFVGGFWFSWRFGLCLVGVFLTPLCAGASIGCSALALRMIPVDSLGGTKELLFSYFDCCCAFSGDCSLSASIWTVGKYSGGISL